MSKEEPFQTKKIRFRQKATRAQQNATKHNKNKQECTQIYKRRKKQTRNSVKTPLKSERNKIQQNRIGYTEKVLLQQNQTETATSNRINKEEPFQTKIYDSDKKRQEHNKTQQNATKINKNVLRYTKEGKNKQETA